MTTHKCKVQMVVEFDVEYTSEEIFEQLYDEAIPAHTYGIHSVNGKGNIKFVRVVKRSLCDVGEVQ